MAVGTATAIIAGALISGGSSAYQAEQQKDIAEEDRKRREKEAAKAKTEAERIARETRPEQEAVKEIEFGTGDDGVIGSTQEFVIPKTTSALGTSTTGRSGLGFTV